MENSSLLGKLIQINKKSPETKKREKQDSVHKEYLSILMRHPDRKENLS